MRPCLVSRAPRITALCFALLAAPALARADDWPQSRRDARHSAWSRDPVTVPLAEIWNWKNLGDGRGRYAPVSNAVAAGGRLFFSGMATGGTSGLASRYLVCADAATGATLWRQPVVAAGASSGAAPVVTPSG